MLDGITSALISNWNTAYSNRHTHSNKTQLDLITQSNIDVLAKLSIVNGNLQIDGNAYATGELSAYGAGPGGGGGGGIIDTVYGYSNLGQTFNNSILTDTFNAYTINQINTRLVAVESGSALTVNTTGTGNAITSISKAGSVITANKDLTFSLSNHTHSYLPLSGGTMANTDLVTNLNADLLDGKHGYQYRGELDLGGLSDFEQVVIALVNLDNSNPIRDEWAYGQMTNKRSNGSHWSGGVTNFAVQKTYNSTSMDGYLDTT